MAKCSNFKTIIAISVLLFVTAVSATTQTPVQKHGWLTAKNGYLYDEHGKIVQLRGMSFYWSTPGWIGASYYTASTLDALVDQWKCTVVRLAYDRNNGNDNGWSLVKTVLDEAIKKGIYVILDWHSHTAENQQSAAVQWFTTQAQAYKNTPNVIFEPYNEPITPTGDKTDGSTATAKKYWPTLKAYHSAVAKAIRDQGANNLIICGTPYYSQHVQIAATDTVPYKNIAYAFHFYAASHGPYAMYVKTEGKGGMEAEYLTGGLGRVTVFITEWGTTHSDGSQQVDATNTQWWFDNYVNGKYKISHCNWSVSSGEGSSAFNGSVNSPSTSGAIVKNLISSPTTDSYDPPDITGTDGPAKSTVFTTPGVLNAFYYNKYYGASFSGQGVSFSQRDDKAYVKTSKDSILKVNPGVKDDWVKYNINATSATSKLVLRCLTGTGGGNIDVYVDAAKTSVQITKKTGWNYVVAPVAVSSGTHTIQFKFTTATDTGYGISWMEFTNTDPGTSVANAAPVIFNKSSISMTACNSGLSVSLPSYHPYTSYTLMSVNGQVIQSGLLSSTENSLSFRDIPTGMVLLKLKGRSESAVFKTLVNKQ